MEVNIPKEKQEEYLRLMVDVSVPEILRREKGTEYDGWKPFADDVDGVRVESIKPDGSGVAGIVRGVTTLDFELDDIHNQSLSATNSEDMTIHMKQMDPTCLEYNIFKPMESPGNSVLRLVHPVYQAPGPIWDRDFCGIQYISIINDEECGERVWVCVVTSVENENVPPTEGRIRATFTHSGFVIREPKNVEEDLRVTYIVQCDLGGAVNPGLVHQMGAIQSRVAGRMRDNSLACKSAARLMDMEFPFPVKYPRPNNRVEWVIDGTKQEDPVVADVVCLGDMDLWLEVSGVTLVEGLNNAFHGRVLLKGWQRQDFTIRANAGSRVVLTFHNPNWIQGARSFVRWDIRERDHTRTQSMHQEVTTHEMVEAGNQAVEKIMQRKMRDPTAKERDELEKLRSKMNKVQEKWGNFWNNVFIAQGDPDLDDEQQLQLFQRIHNAIKEHQNEKTDEEKDPLRIAEQWTNFWSIVLLQQGHNLDEEEQRKNFWERTSIAVKQNQEILKQGWQQWQESKDGMSEEDRITLWHRIQQAIKEHKEAKRQQKEANKKDEGPNLWSKINGVIQNYQKEHAEGKPMDPNNLQQLWVQINGVLKEEITPMMHTSRSMTQFFENDDDRSNQENFGQRKKSERYLPELHHQSSSASEVRISNEGKLESASHRMNMWQWVNESIRHRKRADSIVFSEGFSDVSSQESFEVTSVVESESERSPETVWKNIESTWDKAGRELKVYMENRRRELSLFTERTRELSMVSEVPMQRTLWDKIQVETDKAVKGAQKNIEHLKESIENLQQKRTPRKEAKSQIFSSAYDFDGVVKTDHTSIDGSHEAIKNASSPEHNLEEGFFMSRNASFSSGGSSSTPLEELLKDDGGFGYDVSEYESILSNSEAGSVTSVTDKDNNDSSHQLVQLKGIGIRVLDENECSFIDNNGSTENASKGQDGDV